MKSSAKRFLERKNKKRVMIACCNTGEIHKMVVFAVMKILMDPANTCIPNFIAPTHNPLENSQAHVIEDFLKQGQDFLLFIDSDNPPLRNPLDLVKLNLDVIGIVTPVWANCKPGDIPYYPNVMKAVEVKDSYGRMRTEHRPVIADPKFKAEGLQQVDAVGGGCILIARRVLLVLMSKARGNAMDMPFMRHWCDQTGKVIMGNDFAFCQRARRAGFKIWAHFDYQCEHINKLGIKEVVNAMSSIKRGDS